MKACALATSYGKQALSAVLLDFVNNEITNLLSTGAMFVWCTKKTVCVSPFFCVLKKGNQHPLIIYLRLLDSVCTTFLKNEDIKIAANLI